MPDQDGNLYEWEQRIMDVLNGVLNPPREIDMSDFVDNLETWNNTVLEQFNNKTLTLENINNYKLKYGFPDEMEIRNYTLIELEELIQASEPPENEPYTKKETLNFIREVAEDVRDNSGLSIEEAFPLVRANLLTEWELETTGKNKGKYVIKSDIRANVATTSDIPAYGVLYERSLELDADPRYMTDNDKYYLMLKQASEAGKISNTMYSALTDKDIQEDPEQAAAALQMMGFYPGDDPVATLDAINERYMDDFWVITDEVRDDLKGRTNMERAFADLIGDDPMKVMPVYGRLQITDDQTFNRFAESNFDISKTIEKNITDHMKLAKDSEGNSLDPSYRGRTKELKGAMGEAQRLMITELENSPEGKAYIANPTPENLLDLYKVYENTLHQDYGGQVQTIFTDSLKSDYIETRDNGTETQVNNLAKHILYRFGISAADVTKEDIGDVVSRMGNYEDMESFLQDETAKAEIRKAHIERADSNPFSFDTDEFTGQQQAVQAILMAMLNNGEITPAQYRAYAESSIEKRDFIASLMKGKTSEQEVMAVPQIIDSINEAIAEGEEKIAKEITETEEEKAESARATLNREVKSLIFEDLRKQGIIDDESSPEFLQHIQNKVMADIQRKIILRGGIDDESEIEGIVAEHIGQLPIYERDDASYMVQLAPTAEDVMAGRSLPPGVDPRKIAKPTPEFDISVFTPELQQIAIDNPELAGFISQEMRMPGFESEWQKAAQTRSKESYLDREAAVQLQEDRLASFERIQRGTELDQARTQLEAAQLRLRTAEAPAIPKNVSDYYTPSAEEVRAARRAVVDAERMVAEAPRSAADTAFERAQAQFAREVPSQVTEGQPGFFRSEQNLADIRKMMVQPGQTQKEFFESQLPGFERRFEASPFFKQQQERTEQEEERERRMAEAEERRAESERRTLLRSGRGGGAGTARTVFGRRQ